MRATRSVWARWIADQGWPVPPKLARLIVIEGEAVDTSVLALPAPSIKQNTVNKMRKEGAVHKMHEVYEELKARGQIHERMTIVEQYRMTLNGLDIRDSKRGYSYENFRQKVYRRRE
jgi:hypothetical protein